MRLRFTWSCQAFHLICILGLLIFKWHQASSPRCCFVAAMRSGALLWGSKCFRHMAGPVKKKKVLFVIVSQRAKEHILLLLTSCRDALRKKVLANPDWLPALERLLDINEHRFGVLATLVMTLSVCAALCRRQKEVVSAPWGFQSGERTERWQQRKWTTKLEAGKDRGRWMWTYFRGRPILTHTDAAGPNCIIHMGGASWRSLRDIGPLTLAKALACYTWISAC